MKHYLSVCCIFKDEAPYLEEWLRFYSLIGVEHFYLYDNDSTDAFKAVLAPWAAAGKVTLNRISIPAPQRPAYGHCLSNYGADSRWIAFVDMDEFLFSPIQPDLRIFLKEFESSPAVVANWVMFGSSGHQQKPAGLITLNYTVRCEEHLCTFEPALLKQSGLDPSRPENYHPVCGHIKSIVSPREAIAVGSPHHFLYRHKRPAISAVGAPVPGPFCDDVRIDQLRVNHYFSKCADGGDCGARVRGLSAKPRGMLEGGGRAPRSRGRIPDLAFNLRARQ
jgi:hypothetical protein